MPSLACCSPRSTEASADRSFQCKSSSQVANDASPDRVRASVIRSVHGPVCSRSTGWPLSSWICRSMSQRKPSLIGPQGPSALRSRFSTSRTSCSSSAVSAGAGLAKASQLCSPSLSSLRSNSRNRKAMPGAQAVEDGRLSPYRWCCLAPTARPSLDTVSAVFAHLAGNKAHFRVWLYTIGRRFA